MKPLDHLKSSISATLNLFPEVAWDRWSGEINEKIGVYGWLKRTDGQRDFMLLIFDEGEFEAYATSSAKYSSEFGTRLGFTAHNDCKLVSEHFTIGAKITPHTQYICKCSNPYCQFCEGGLYACTVCGGMEGTLTTDCCGRRLTTDEEDRIYNQHKLNFRDGQWREEDSFKQETHV